MTASVRRRQQPWRGVGVVACALMWTAGCSSPSAPSPPVPILTLSCPTVPTAFSLDGRAVVVSYPEPVASGGVAPIVTSCSPQSGSAFAPGTTAVICTAHDADQRTAACPISVNVVVPPQLEKTRFVAFGDSITQGVLGVCNGLSATATFQERMADLFAPRAVVADPYPSRLRQLLANRYVGQAPTVANAGEGGNLVTSVNEPNRLNTAITTSGAEVLLLQEGVNDLHLLSSVAAIPTVVEALRSLAKVATSRDVRVIVGTLLPERPNTCRGFHPELIEPANLQIRAMAIAEGLQLVDLYQVFSGNVSTFIDQDGLHPSAAGYQAIADAFFAAIRTSLEKPPPR